MTVVDEPTRLAALRRLRVLDTAPEERFDRVVRIAQRLFGVPLVAVNLIDADRQWTKAHVGMPALEAPRETSFCARTMTRTEPFVVEDASRDERFRDWSNVRGEPHIRFYAGAPLIGPGGQPVGALCVVDSEPRTLSAAERGLLVDLAALVEKELARDQELQQAAEMLRLMQPQERLDLPGFTLAGACLPAREVGGDFFDWYRLSDGTVQLVLGDVMGKGVPAALIASSVRAVVRGASRFNPLPEAITRTGFSLDYDLEGTSTFVTMFCARVDAEAAEVEYVDAGHGLSLLLRADGSFEQLRSEDLPLGALPQDSWASRRVALGRGDVMVCASDGFLDVFGSLAACLDAVRRARGAGTASPDAASVVEALTDAALLHGLPEDDLTVVVLVREDS